jgi:hypothetical protein
VTTSQEIVGVWIVRLAKPVDLREHHGRHALQSDDDLLARRPL